jgi:hypothetical protein
VAPTTPYPDLFFVSNHHSLSYQQAFAQSNFFRIVNPIQIQHKYMIENPNLKPLLKNPNPITIQPNKREQTLKAFCACVLNMKFPRDIF